MRYVTLWIPLIRGVKVLCMCIYPYTLIHTNGYNGNGSIITFNRISHSTCVCSITDNSNRLYSARNTALVLVCSTAVILVDGCSVRSLSFLQVNVHTNVLFMYMQRLYSVSKK